MSSSSSSSLPKKDFQRKFNEDQERQDALLQRQLDANISRMQYFMELTNDPDDLEIQLDLMSGVHFDWKRYKCMDVAMDNNVCRYPMPQDYYTSLRDVDVLLRSAIGNVEKHPAYRASSLKLWLSDLPTILGCEIRLSDVHVDFREPEYPTLTFTGHEYVLERLPSVKLYVVTVCDPALQVTKIFDYFFFYFNDDADV